MIITVIIDDFLTNFKTLITPLSQLSHSKKNKITGDEVFGEDANEKKRKYENGDQMWKW